MWKLIYSHDTNGTRTGGDKDELIKLVQDGQPVRIMFDVDDSRVTSLNCESVFIRFGEVYAQTSFVYSDWSDPDRELMRFSAPSSVMIFNLSTSGKSHVRSQHSPELVDDRVVRHGISWFVQE